MRPRSFSLGANAIYGFIFNSLEQISLLGPSLRFCTAVHRGKRIWPDAYWPDAAPRRDFRNLWFAAPRGDTGIAGVGFQGSGDRNPPPWNAETAHRGRIERLSVASSLGHFPRDHWRPVATHWVPGPNRRLEQRRHGRSGERQPKLRVGDGRH